VEESFFLMHLSRKIKSMISGDVTAQIVPSAKPDLFVDSVYTKNLRLIRALSEHIEAKVIFVPQVLNIGAYVNTQEVSDYWTPSIQNKAMPQLMNRFNELAIAACSGNDGVVVANAPAMHPWEAEHFIDKAHFSKKGSEIFVDKVVLTALRDAGIW
jgi:hypothetical protein